MPGVSAMPRKPSRRRMTLLALRVLEQAYLDAEQEPRPQTPATKLALGWLLLEGIAELHQAASDDRHA